jgi:hypothetical protein
MTLAVSRSNSASSLLHKCVARLILNCACTSVQVPGPDLARYLWQVEVHQVGPRPLSKARFELCERVQERTLISLATVYQSYVILCLCHLNINLPVDIYTATRLFDQQGAIRVISGETHAAYY